MLRDFLEQHGFSVVCLNGSMDLEERRRVQRQFAEKARILVSTDAGGEGLNLQFAHVVVNYDLPWNPMRIEQRIGRVDRIGQKFPVKAFNLIFEDSVELRVQEVLEDKLATILDEFGVDKTEDVLDSAESGAIFERLYAQAILNPGDIEKNIDRLIQEVREQARQEQAGRSFYGETVLDPTLAQQLSSHPLPFWVERMTTAYLRSEGGKVRKGLFGYDLEWPDGSRMERVSFLGREAQDRGLAHVSLEDDRIRRLVQQLPRVVPGQPIPHVVLGDLPAEVVGYWSLWRIALDHRRVAGREDHPDLSPRRRAHPPADRPAHLGPPAGRAAEVRTQGFRGRAGRRAPSSSASGPRPNVRDRRLRRAACPASAAIEAGTGEGPVRLPGAPGCARPHRPARSPASIRLRSWTRRSGPGRTSCASGSKSCPNSSRSFSCGWRQGMANWRDTILKNFQPKISRLTLVADPDGLLTEEGMLSAIRERGFDLIPFDDPIAFRFAYESQYRSQWDQGQKTDLVVVLRSAEQQLDQSALRSAQGGTATDLRPAPVVPEAELPGDRRAGSCLPRRR